MAALTIFFHPAAPPPVNAGIHVDPHLSVMFPHLGFWAFIQKGGVAALTIFFHPAAPPKEPRRLLAPLLFQNLVETNSQFL